MIYGYARVSSRGQARDGNSLKAQVEVLKENGAQIIFKDSFTGTKMDRPEFDKLLQIIGSGDKLIVTKLDRFARTARHGMEVIQQLLDKGVSVHVLNMGLIDRSPTGRLITQIMLAFAEFEADMIRERTAEGKIAAKQKPGYREGRPPKYTEDQLTYAMILLEENSFSKVAKITGISKTTLVTAKRRLQTEEMR